MSDWPYPFWIAHRGAGLLAPENTLAAFRLGASQGWRMFECDVKLSADGVPFLLHDATLERTTSGRGSAGDKPWSELARLDAGAWHGRAYAGEPIPGFAAIARYCLANGFALNIELKPTPGHEAETGRVVAREAARLWAGQKLQPLVSSFHPAALEGAMWSAPDLPRALLLEEMNERWFDVATELECDACVVEHTLVDAALLQRLHRADLRALCYTVNEPADVERLKALGVDGVITDAVDRFTPV